MNTIDDSDQGTVKAIVLDLGAMTELGWKLDTTDTADKACIPSQWIARLNLIYAHALNSGNDWAFTALGTERR